ncbi:MAG: cytochrome c oxidase subunit II [Betaproteobacteria bacterium RIFCSPLOWO2_02_FULL_65_24]|nr:MAG: cytochrome c oxidase subunit II [Betaproteobacteria bacterium RIFCSPLOWO2_02_FULL_65_24]OGA96714.1 MAG: cytochrome c oxidase subunit II [Betaproteobacteria bacterium RIFCSPLOWO2_12_FULL_66_14]
MPGAALAQSNIVYNLQDPVTRVGQSIYDLHTLMFWMSVAIFVAVFSVMIYAMFAHRKSLGHKAAQFHENTTVEFVWTVIPFLILIGMAWPATRVLLAIKDTGSPDLTIKVTGYQWKWGYEYLKGEGEGVSFMSSLATPHEQIYGNEAKGQNYLLEVDRPLVVPVGKKVRLLLTANDVIHAWWVPAFGVKQDAIPGFVRDNWFRVEKEGVYRGQCAELCGKDHGFMPIVVEVLSAEKYAAWAGEQKKIMAAAADDPGKTWDVKDLIARGEKAYAANCAACHQPNGQGVPNLFPPLVSSKAVLGPDAEQIAIVLHGRKGAYRPNTIMPPLANLSDVDIAAAITYTRNAWGNKAEDNLVQPAEVKAARK